MKFIDTLFGKPAPASSDLAGAQSEKTAERAATARRIQANEAILSDLAVLTDEQHAAAESALAADRRGLGRLDAQLAEIATALDEARAVEAKAALQARRDDLDRRAKKDGAAALAAYAKHAALAAAAIAQFEAFDVEIAATNKELRAADLPGLADMTSRFRKAPDVIIPERREMRRSWEAPDRDGNMRPATVLQSLGGELRPQRIDAQPIDKEVVIQAADRLIGRKLLPLGERVVLPAAYPGTADIWPRG